MKSVFVKLGAIVGLASIGAAIGCIPLAFVKVYGNFLGTILLILPMTGGVCGALLTTRDRSRRAKIGWSVLGAFIGVWVLGALLAVALSGTTGAAVG